MEYHFIFEDEYFEDAKKHKKSGQKKILQKIVILLEEIKNHPTTGTGQVEPLKGYGDRNVWSRRIDKKTSSDL